MRPPNLPRLLLPLFVAACDRARQPAPEPPPRPAPIVETPLGEAAPPEPTAAATSGPDAAGAQGGDAPEISRSLGVEGGLVVLWPRIAMPRSAPVPDAEMLAIARRLQARLAELARRAAPGRALDVRPQPERVCPRSGCRATAIGSIVTRAGGGCAALVSVSRPGPSPARLGAWIGRIELDTSELPFRSPPEAVIHVKDYVPCARLADETTGDAAVQALIGAAR